MDIAACLATGSSSIPWCTLLCRQNEMLRKGKNVQCRNLLRASVTRTSRGKIGCFGRLPSSINYLAKTRISALNAESGNDSEGGFDGSLPPAIDEVLNYLGATYDGDSLNQFENVESRGTSEDQIGLQEGYVGLFVRLLGLDNPVEEREEAVQALWRHSAGGKVYIDQIVEFPGCLNLIVSLLPSDRVASSEAAAGVLRNISSINAYRSAVTEAGALEEIVGLLTRRSIPSEVREQATCVLWNLSVEEGPRAKLVEPEILHVLLTMLVSENEGEREAGAGVLANLSLSACYHEILVEAGIIPKLARLLLDDGQMSKVARQEARNALLELAKDDHVKLLIIDEGLVLVPVIGASAYRSFKPLLQEAPILPESVNLQQTTPKPPSTFGAGELLLGLNLESDGDDIDDAARLIIEGRVRQQFLARVGVIGKKSSKGDKSGDEHITLMPWWDGITRLVLILGLDNLTVAKQAVEAIAQIAINEESRQAVQKAGAIPHLVRLLGCDDEDITEAAASALEKLAISRQVRRSINAHDAPSALVAILKAPNAPQTLKEKVVGALSRLSRTGDEVEAVILQGGGTISGLMDIVSSESASEDEKEEAEEILEELASLKAEPTIVAAGGVPHLLRIMVDGSPAYAEKAACVLENLAIEDSNAVALFEAGVESALTTLLDVTFEEGTVTRKDGRTFMSEDGYMLIGAGSRLLEKLARYEKLKNPSHLANLLTNILQSDVPLLVKDWVSACLLKLEQMAKGFGEDYRLEVPVDIEVNIHDTIPWLVTEIGKDFSPTVRERAVMHLRQLMSQGTSAYSTAIANAGGVYPLVDLLKRGTADARAASLAVLYNLSMNEENHPVILAAGAVPTLVDLVRRGVPEWKLALYLLRALPS